MGDLNEEVVWLGGEREGTLVGLIISPQPTKILPPPPIWGENGRDEGVCGKLSIYPLSSLHTNCVGFFFFFPPFLFSFLNLMAIFFSNLNNRVFNYKLLILLLLSSSSSSSLLLLYTSLIGNLYKLYFLYSYFSSQLNKRVMHKKKLNLFHSPTFSSQLNKA